MERNFNIAEILKDKPKSTKLYADAFGELSIEEICTEDNHGITLSDNGGTDWLFYNDGKYSWRGESILVPSKEMRDWHKFAWKKGDVLVNSGGLKILFDRWANDNYTSFYAKTINLVEDAFLDTNLHTLASEKEAKSFIKYIEEKLGGKLNLETLEIEKQPEFKDGDIITITPQIGNNIIFILRKEDVENYYGHAFLDGNIAIINKDCYCKKEFNTVRQSTEEEKQQLFSALEKKGKVWDAEKKEVVDLKPKVDELKPFDKVLVKDNTYGSWEPALFWKKVDVKDLHPYKIIGGKRYRYCEPYEGNEHLLDN